MIWLIGFDITVHKMLKVEISEKLLRQQKLPKSCIFKSGHVANYSSKSSNLYHFLKELNEIFQMCLSILPKLWLVFLDILMIITPGVNILTRQTTPIFPIFSLNSICLLVYFIFVFQDLQNLIPWGSPFALCSSL